MKKCILRLTMLWVIFFLAHTAQAQKEQFQSLFVYNFMKYVKWPDAQNKSNFVIGVVGKGAMLQSLQAMAKKKSQLNGRPIQVVQLDDASEYKSCQIIFIEQGKSDALGQISAATQNQPILVITDQKGLATQGAVINFMEDGGKIKFELNKSQADSRGLKIAGQLLSLAIVV